MGSYLAWHRTSFPLLKLQQHHQQRCPRSEKESHFYNLAKDGGPSNAHKESANRFFHRQSHWKNLNPYCAAMPRPANHFNAPIAPSIANPAHSDFGAGTPAGSSTVLAAIGIGGAAH